MQAEALSVSALFAPERLFRAPLFQRRYVWNEIEHLTPFWADVERHAIQRLAGKPAQVPHFMGAILLQADAVNKEAAGNEAAEHSKASEATPECATPSRPPPESLRIIDGQQRLITLHLSLAALAQAAAAHELDFVALTARRFLENKNSAHPEKLHGVDADAEHIQYAVNIGSQKAISQRWPERFAKNGARLRRNSARPDCLTAYITLLNWAQAFIQGERQTAAGAAMMDASMAERADALLQALLHDFHLVAIFLEQEDDGPAIFEALNDRGAPLDASDLVQNDIVRRARANGEDAAALIQHYWLSFANQPFWRKTEVVGRARRPRLDNLLRHYLVAVSAGRPVGDRVFHAYRAYIAGAPPPFPSVADELAEIARAGEKYRALIEHSPKADAPALQRLGARLIPWQPSAAYPPILTIALAETRRLDAENSAGVDAGASARANSDEGSGGADCGHNADRSNDNAGLSAACNCILGYLVRRAICGLSRRNLHRTLAGLCRQMQRSGASIATVSRFLANQPGIDGLWPPNARFADNWINQPLHRQNDGRRVRQILLELEAAQSGRPIAEIMEEAPQVDHIMPRDWSDAARRHWPDPPYDDTMAMDDLVRARNQAVDSIGNLTLLEPKLNAHLRNVGFEDRRQVYSESRYAATRALADVDQWDERAMRARATAWLPLAFELWPGPDAAIAFNFD